MSDINDDRYISESDSYNEQSATEALSVLDNNCTPLPMLMQELYGSRRIVFYSCESICRKFINLINAFLFYYGENIVFCSDKSFALYGGRYEWSISFHSVGDITLHDGDVLFVFDFNCRRSVIEEFRAQNCKKITEAIFRKAFIGSLIYYAFRIRPVKNFSALNPGVNIVLIDNFTPDYKNLTEWEKYLRDNKLTREKMIEKLKSGEYPYPDGVYIKKYTPQQLLSMHFVPDRETDERGVFSLKDYKSEFLNTADGLRVTCGQPASFKRSIHIFGGCGFFGVGVPDCSTFASRLQSMFNDYAPERAVKVINHGSFIWGKHDAMWYMLNSVRYNSGDIVVLPYNQRWAQYFYKNIPAIRYADITFHSGAEIFNDTWHPSECGLKIYAENLFTYLKSNNFLEGEPQATDIRICKPKIYGIPAFADATKKSETDLNLAEENMAGLKKYIDKICVLKPQIGAIVMNCNPFTLGHRYLIEYAASRVAVLYIFAVQEDRSFFPFEDRIELIRRGTADFKNVVVLPSGNFIISSLTFTDYFGKSKLQEKKIDASLDLEIFGRYIAPALGITVRFAGEEPIDKVTMQYNEQMQKILPRYGIKFVVIPRKKAEGEVISASRVRQLLKTKNFVAIKQLVPETTYNYLLDKFK